MHDSSPPPAPASSEIRGNEHTEPTASLVECNSYGVRHIIFPPHRGDFYVPGGGGGRSNACKVWVKFKPGTSCTDIVEVAGAPYGHDKHASEKRRKLERRQAAGGKARPTTRHSCSPEKWRGVQYRRWWGTVVGRRDGSL